MVSERREGGGIMYRKIWRKRLFEALNPVIKMVAWRKMVVGQFCRMLVPFSEVWISLGLRRPEIVGSIVPFETY